MLSWVELEKSFITSGPGLTSGTDISLTQMDIEVESSFVLKIHNVSI